MTKRVLVLVEGQTEETFVNEVLFAHLSPMDIFPKATQVYNRRTANCRTSRGGVTSYEKIRNDIRLLCNDTNAKAITTMFDFYRFPSDAPGYNTLPLGNCFERVVYLENAMKEDIVNERFIPYLMLHEFEAMLFADPQSLKYVFPENERLISRVETINRQFNSPEEINESIENAPSKRLQSIFPDYNKVLHGSISVLEIGIPEIRTKCLHFNDWLSRLETL